MRLNFLQPNTTIGSSYWGILPLWGEMSQHHLYLAHIFFTLQKTTRKDIVSIDFHC